MRKHILARSLLAFGATGFFLNAYAVSPGLYIGVMAGPATNTGKPVQAQTKNLQTTVTATPKSTQFGSRIFLGYKMSQYAGVEGGLTYFSTIDFNTKNNVQTCSSTNARVRDFDLVGKGMFPLGNSFDVFGKAGVAVAYETTSGALNSTSTSACGKTTYVTKFRPTISIGASYDISQNWVTDLSWNRVFVGGAAGDVSLFALGISYHFVDVYCGQFLCS